MPPVYNQPINQEENFIIYAYHNTEENEFPISELPPVHNQSINQEDNISIPTNHNSHKNRDDTHNTAVDESNDNLKEHNVAISTELSLHLDHIEQIFIPNFSPETIFSSKENLIQVAVDIGKQLGLILLTYGEHN